MKLSNRLCTLLDIDYPIIQGGMAWVATGELASAVSEAGGLGIIGAGNAPADVIKNEIRKVKDSTEKPFGVNIMLLSPHAEDIVDLVIKEKVPVVTTGAGNPGRYIESFKKIGTKVFPVIPSVSLAQRMERLGVDGVIAEGNESGGHIGQLTTMTLIPQVVDSINIPVIAAGGIADGRGLIAAMALGASGIQIGTRFICSKECTAHPEYKEAIVKAKDREAVVTGRSTGHPVRNLKNNLTRKMNDMESKGVSIEEIENLGRGKLQLAVKDGKVKEGSIMAGLSAGLIKDIKSVKEIIDNIIQEAEDIRGNLFL